jgi:hypothetical protein
MVFKNLIRKNKLTVSILIFTLLFFSIHSLKPKLFYNDDGSFRQFGLGYRQKTIIPIWVVSIILAILIYLAVLYIIMYF